MEEYSEVECPYSILSRVFPGVGDHRLFDTVTRYLEKNHLMLKETEDGSLALAKTYQSDAPAQQLSVSHLLDNLIRWSYVAQKKAQDSYARMCAEEDTEEFYLLKEVYEKASSYRGMEDGSIPEMYSDPGPLDQEEPDEEEMEQIRHSQQLHADDALSDIVALF